MVIMNALHFLEEHLYMLKMFTLDEDIKLLLISHIRRTVELRYPADPGLWDLPLGKIIRPYADVIVMIYGDAMKLMRNGWIDISEI